MNGFRNLKTKTKLVLGFGLVIVFLIVISVISISGYKDSDKEYTSLIDNNVAGAFVVDEVQLTFINSRRIIATMAFQGLLGDQTQVAAQMKNYENELKKIKDLAQSYKDIIQRSTTVNQEFKDSRKATMDTLLADRKSVV